ncbi:hypothetical protein [Prosthecobacter sp.]|uniref:hypothetical protein n=1 Tax=Prosthecobacter sp. TaxID=1965333 RepID=UPI003782F193
MSTASEDLSSDQPQRTSHQPGPLAVLAATAIGGVLATRMGKAPLLFAAGAAAMAMLRQKKTPAPPPPATPKSLPPPAPPLEVPAQSQVEQWLSRQIIREEQAPVVDLSMADVTPDEPEDDYRPESFLLDEWDEFPRSPPPDNDAFASLTEPAPQPISEPAPQLEETAVEEEPKAPSPPPQVLLQPPLPSPPVVADGAWTLGVDPMPSLNEAEPYVAPVGTMFSSAPVPQEAPRSSMEPPRSQLFSTAPVQHEEPGPPLFFSTSLFQGAAFPDEIQVAPPLAAASPMPSPEPSVEDPVWEPAPVFERPPEAAAAPEIPVVLAPLGEASFDPPLVAAPYNPWQSEPEVFATTPPVPFQPQMASTVVEAEIILRPRAPMQNSVTTKSKFAPSGFAKPFSSEDSAAPPAENANDAHFPGPLQSQHDPKPRPTWRSWWRDD